MSVEVQRFRNICLLLQNIWIQVDIKTVVYNYFRHVCLPDFRQKTKFALTLYLIPYQLPQIIKKRFKRVIMKVCPSRTYQNVDVLLPPPPKLL